MEKKLWQRILLFIGCILGSIGMLVIGQILGSVLFSIPHVILKSINPKMLSDAWVTGEGYIYTIGIWLVVLVFMLISKKSRPILKVIGRKSKGNTGINFLIGLLIGFGLNGICAFIAWMNHDIELEYSGFHLISFLVIFLCVLVQSSSEEVICRGFLYQKGIQYFQKPVIAILTNSMLFAILHIFNSGVTLISLINIFLSGLLFSMIVYYFDSLWCTFAVHTAWNFTQNILLGLPNSGMLVPYSVFKLNASTARNSFAYDVNFGIEGTIVADIVLSLACLTIFLWGRKHRKKPYDVWKAENEQSSSLDSEEATKDNEVQG